MPITAGTLGKGVTITSLVGGSAAAGGMGLSKANELESQIEELKTFEIDYAKIKESVMEGLKENEGEHSYEGINKNINELLLQTKTMTEKIDHQLKELQSESDRYDVDYHRFIAGLDALHNDVHEIATKGLNTFIEQRKNVDALKTLAETLTKKGKETQQLAIDILQAWCKEKHKDTPQDDNKIKTCIVNIQNQIAGKHQRGDT